MAEGSVTRERLPIVLKQGTYCENVTALLIVKNQIQEFYHKVYVLLSSSFDRDAREGRIGDIMDDVPVGLSWKRASKKGLRRLVSFSYSIDSNHGMPCDICSEFIIAASKDLSPMKNPEAARLLRELRVICRVEAPMSIVFARKIIRRPCDDSAVIILHVSSFTDFLGMISCEAGSEVAVDLIDGVIMP